MAIDFRSPAHCSSSNKRTQGLDDPSRRNDDSQGVVHRGSTGLNNRPREESAYLIESVGNGLLCQITRRSDGATVFLQGDGAIQLDEALGRTSDHVTDDDVVSLYFS